MHMFIMEVQHPPGVWSEPCPVIVLVVVLLQNINGRWSRTLMMTVFLKWWCAQVNSTPAESLLVTWHGNPPGQEKNSMSLFSKNICLDFWFLRPGGTIWGAARTKKLTSDVWCLKELERTCCCWRTFWILWFWSCYFSSDPERPHPPLPQSKEASSEPLLLLLVSCRLVAESSAVEELLFTVVLFLCGSRSGTVFV